MHSVSLARASCIGVFSEALRSFMRIRFNCQYAARLEVCVLKFITGETAPSSFDGKLWAEVSLAFTL